MPRFAWGSLLLLALAACSSTSVRLGPDSDPRVARQLLVTAAQTGPVRMEINGVVRASDSTLLQPRLAEQAARGVPNLSVRFTDTPGAPGSAMLLLLFDPSAALDLKRVCATYNAVVRPACYSLAWTYYQAVSVFGSVAAVSQADLDRAARMKADAQRRAAATA